MCYVISVGLKIFAYPYAFRTCTKKALPNKSVSKHINKNYHTQKEYKYVNTSPLLSKQVSPTPGYGK